MELTLIQYKKRVQTAFIRIFGMYMDNLELYILDDFLEDQYYNQDIAPKEAARMIGTEAGLTEFKLMK